MNIQSISPYIPNTIEPQKQSPAQKSDGKTAKDSVYLNKNTMSVSGYDQKGQVSETGANTEPLKSYQALKLQIYREIWNQAYTLLQAYSEKENTASIFEDGLARMIESGADPQDPVGLNAYYTQNPEDWEKVQRGEIPNYFNVENTGNRILAIWIGNSERTDSSVEFLTQVKNYINQAYGEVTDMLGGLPQLVLDTQSYIQEQLDSLIEQAARSETQGETDVINIIA